MFVLYVLCSMFAVLSLCYGKVFRQPLPILHVTLLALHPGILEVTLTFAPGAPKHQKFLHRARAQYSHKTPTSDLHHHPNCFSMSMQLTPPAEGYYEHTLLDLLIKQINEHAKIEGYVTVPDSQPSTRGARQRGGPARWTRRTCRRYSEGHDECFSGVIR